MIPVQLSEKKKCVSATEDNEASVIEDYQQRQVGGMMNDVPQFGSRRAIECGRLNEAGVSVRNCGAKILQKFLYFQSRKKLKSRPSKWTKPRPRLGMRDAATILEQPTSWRGRVDVEKHGRMSTQGADFERVPGL